MEQQLEPLEHRQRGYQRTQLSERGRRGQRLRHDVELPQRQRQGQLADLCPDGRRRIGHRDEPSGLGRRRRAHIQHRDGDIGRGRHGDGPRHRLPHAGRGTALGGGGERKRTDHHVHLRAEPALRNDGRGQRHLPHRREMVRRGHALEPNGYQRRAIHLAIQRRRCPSAHTRHA